MFIQLTTLIAILGALYVAANKALAANILWSISNPSLAIYNLLNTQPEQALMFAVFSLIAISGVYYLTRKHGRRWYATEEWNLFTKAKEESP